MYFEGHGHPYGALRHESCDMPKEAVAYTSSSMLFTNAHSGTILQKGVVLACEEDLRDTKRDSVSLLNHSSAYELSGLQL
jgi:hypothetical protein